MNFATHTPLCFFWRIDILTSIMPVARPEPSEIRVIAHVDLDCFYVQVEQRKHPELRGKPTGVVQYNPWKGGGLIAVGYEARGFGVKRNMRGDEAKTVCPEIELVQVPVAHGKADLTQYRDAGSEVVAVLARKGICERASIDEVYLDITEASAELLHQENPLTSQSSSEEVLKSHIVGHSEGDDERSSTVRQWLCRSEADPKDKMLACGAVVIAELRLAVLAETTFTCSAGIAHNKMLAKLASGMHKPAQQTLVPFSSVPNLLATLPIKKMKQLGGKLGDSLQENLKVLFVGDLLQFSESKLQDMYGINTGTWLWNIARGMSGDEVKARTLPKSHSCGKTFPGPQALKNLGVVEHWLKELAAELQERLDVDFEHNHRTAHLLTVHAGTNHGYKNQDRKFPSKSCMLRYGKDKIAQDALKLFERGLNEFCTAYHISPCKKDGASSGGWAVTSLFIGASNIFATPAGMNPITSFFSTPASPSEQCVKDSVGPSHPLELSPVSLSVDECLSPPAAVSLHDEADMITCKKGHIFGSTIDKCNLVCSSKDYDPICSNSLMPKIDQPKSNDEVVIDVLDSNEVTCTPTFGCLGHTKTVQCNFKLPGGTSCSFDVDVSRDCTGVEVIENSFQASPLVIHCSPIEDAADTEVLKENIDIKHDSELEVKQTVKKICSSSFSADQLRSENESWLLRMKKPPQFGATGSSQHSGSLKLDDIWQHKAVNASLTVRSDSLSDSGWNYRQGGIDEAVLSELPEEIQEEISKSLGLKRPRIAKCCTIGDFFRHS